jgi:hypothetical protein
MDRDAYNDHPAVRDFLEWARPRISEPGMIRQQWTSPKYGAWSCSSVFNAYELFEWRFSVLLPGSTEPVRGCSWGRNVAVLDRLRDLLRASADQGDPCAFLEAAICVVEWGGVRQGNKRLLHEDLGDTALPTLTATARDLDPARADLRQLDGIRHMNSGFSKIYSLLIDGFPIYDSRVACALASLVQWYCEQRELTEVPEPLALEIPPSQSRGHQNLSTALPLFPTLRWGQPARYAASNIKAAWLLGALAEEPPFAGLEPDRRLLALQSAMFMIGYAPLSRGA